MAQEANKGMEESADPEQVAYYTNRELRKYLPSRLGPNLGWKYGKRRKKSSKFLIPSRRKDKSNGKDQSGN